MVCAHTLIHDQAHLCGITTMLFTDSTFQLDTKPSHGTSTLVKNIKKMFMHVEAISALQFKDLSWWYTGNITGLFR